MAITWGAGTSVTSGGNAFRIGYELTYAPTSVTGSTTAVTATLRLYVGTRGAVSDSSNTYSVSGGFSASGSKAISHTSTTTWSTSNVTLVGTWSKSVALSYTSRATVAFSATMSGIEATPGTARVEGSILVPLRPVSAAAAPTNVGVARSSDSRHTVTWTNQPTTAAPYDRIEVLRWDSASATYKIIASGLAGTATSFVDTSTTGNLRYRYAVRGTNAAGKGAYGYSPYFFTSPAPTKIDGAKKVGADIQLNWARHAYPEAHYEVQDIADGVPQTPTFFTAANAWGYTHASANPAATHAYRVRSRIVDPVVGTLTSAWSLNSITVQLQAKPAAPTHLAPANGAMDATEPITLTWRHNPVDTTAQSAFTVDYRPQGGTWSTTGKITSPASSYTLPAVTIDNGTTLEWQVRTWGDHADPSPWSALAVVQASARPSVQLAEVPSVVHGTSVVVRWDFFDPEGSAQAQYRVRLTQGGSLVWSTSGRGPGVAQTVGHRLEDGLTYTVAVDAQDGTGLWSMPAQATFTVQYALPPTGDLTARFDLDTGSVLVEISHPDPGEGQEAPVSCELWRSAGGEDWVLLADDLPLQTTVVDPLPALDTQTAYRLVTVSALPSTAEAAPVLVVARSFGWSYLNGGPNFSEVVRFKDNAKAGSTEGSPIELVHLAGRALPVEVAEELQSRSVQVSTQLEPNPEGGSTLAELMAFRRRNRAPIGYRDPLGRRWFVSLSDVSGNQERIFATASFTVTAIDYTE